MITFQPLAVQRVLRDDRALTGQQKALLWVATLRADNETDRTRGKQAGHVRASLELLAKDASCSTRTAGRVFAPGAADVVRYFARIDRQTRAVHLWFRLDLTADSVSGVVQLTADSVSTTPDSVSTTPDRESHHLLSPALTPAAQTAAARLATAANCTQAQAAAAITALLQEKADDGRPVHSPEAFVAKCWRANPDDMRRRIGLVTEQQQQADGAADDAALVGSCPPGAETHHRKAAALTRNLEAGVTPDRAEHLQHLLDQELAEVERHRRRHHARQLRAV